MKFNPNDGYVIHNFHRLVFWAPIGFPIDLHSLTLKALTDFITRGLAMAKQLQGRANYTLI